MRMMEYASVDSTLAFDVFYERYFKYNLQRKNFKLQNQEK